MAGQALELAGLFLTLVGLIGAAASTGMPMWRVTAFIGENIIVMENRYEGLWMNCFQQATIRMQCKVYDSLLALTPDLQAARGLMCCSVALATIGLLLAITGMRCTMCIQGNDRAKRMVLIVAGSLTILSCLCCLIPVSWTGNVIIRDFYNPLLIDAQRRELGAALYIGWVSSAFLFGGGCIFACCSGSFSTDPRPNHGAYNKGVPYVAYQPQPQLQPQLQPLTLQTRPPAAYSFVSREPSFLQPSSHPSIIQTSRQASFLRPSRPQSMKSGIAYL